MIVMLSDLVEQGEVSQVKQSGIMKTGLVCPSGGVLPVLAWANVPELWRVQS